jgi:hypothetical protein
MSTYGKRNPLRTSESPRIVRSIARSDGIAWSSPNRSSMDYIIATRGYSFRKGQVRAGLKPSLLLRLRWTACFPLSKRGR